MNNYPDDRFYYEQHEWLKMIDEKTGIVGISYYAQDSLGDIVYLQAPETGKEVAQGEEVAEIESVKAVSTIYSPVSGKIVEVNEEVINSPEIINQDPYEKGWIYKIEITNPDELNSLMNAETYRRFIEEG